MALPFCFWAVKRDNFQLTPWRCTVTVPKLMGKRTNWVETTKPKKITSFLKKLPEVREFLEFEWTIDLWDTAGQEAYDSMHPSYYFAANACIMVFDITRQESYSNLRKWYTEMRQFCPNIPAILLANKIDGKPFEIQVEMSHPHTNESVDREWKNLGCFEEQETGLWVCSFGLSCF